MKSRRSLTTLLASAVLLSNLNVGAQTQGPSGGGGQQPRVRGEKRVVDRVIVAPGPDGDMPFHFQTVAPAAPGEAFGFSWVSAEMSFDGKLVKGAPYSAEATTETVQTLSDGNRITRKSTALLYRDGEGRTRRDQTLNSIGPWATADEPPHHVFINDTVSGTNFVLDPRSKTARRSHFFFRTTEGDGREFQVHIAPPPHPAIPGMPPMPPDMAEPALAPSAPVAAGIAGRGALKRVQPVYPEVAKAAGAEGTVEVEIVIGESGEVVSAKAVKGHPLLHQASVDAARQWTFKPTQLSGKPVKVSGRVTFNFVLSQKNEQENIVMLRNLAPPPPPHPPHSGGVAMRESPIGLPRQEAVKESLGKQMFDGVEAEGTRTTLTIPANAIGNERPINIVSERWYAPELQTVVMTKHSDPRFGETSYRLTNINRGEPSRTLFEVPADYTIKEDRPPMGIGTGVGTGGGTFRIRRQ
ncbi:MAG: energy transducer TonB [Pyrinomonadaceae bacterium]|nr:energy transducer TonB [Pyrinomonadaceae bacterium]